MRVKVGISLFSVDPSSSPTFGVLWLGHVDIEEDVMYTKKIAFTYVYLCMLANNLRSLLAQLAKKDSLACSSSIPVCGRLGGLT